jgi:hypothetical protein
MTVIGIIVALCYQLTVILDLIGWLPILAQLKLWHAKICTHQLIHCQRIGTPIFMAKVFASL